MASPPRHVLDTIKDELQALIEKGASDSEIGSVLEFYTNEYDLSPELRTKIWRWVDAEKKKHSKLSSTSDLHALKAKIDAIIAEDPQNHTALRNLIRDYATSHEFPPSTQEKVLKYISSKQAMQKKTEGALVDALRFYALKHGQFDALDLIDDKSILTARQNDPLPLDEALQHLVDAKTLIFDDGQYFTPSAYVKYRASKQEILQTITLAEEENAIYSKLAVVDSDLAWINEARKAFYYGISANTYPIIYNRLQMLDVIDIRNQYLEHATDTDKIILKTEFLKLLDNIYPTLADFLTHLQPLLNPKSPLMTHPVTWKNKLFPTHFDLMVQKLEYVVLGGQKQSDGLYSLPPTMSPSWKKNSVALLKRLYDEVMDEYFVGFRQQIALLESTIQNVPNQYKHYFRLPVVNFGTNNIPYYIISDTGFFDGLYTYSASQNYATYTIDLHQWHVFWAMYGQEKGILYREALKAIMHHEMIHLIQMQYNKIFEFRRDPHHADLYESINKQSNGAFDLAQQIWFVRSDDPDVIFPFRGQDQTLESIFKTVVQERQLYRKDMKGNEKIPSISQYQKAWQDHDPAFVYWAVRDPERSYGRRTGECRQSLLERKELMGLSSRQLWKIRKQNLTSLRFLSCDPNAHINPTLT